MAVNKNADDYAAARLGIFFPASSNNTLNDGDLTGQCVTLDKWFLKEMTDVPNPGTARGHAKDYGDALVNQGHAIKVSEGERKRGDLVVWKSDGGGYGHIGVLLSGDRVFEQNVGIAGSASRIIRSGNDSWTVYASRIDPLYQSWRKGAPTFYRIKSYSEEEIVKPSEAQVRAVFQKYLGRAPNDQAQIDHYLNRDIRDLYSDVIGTTSPTDQEVQEAFAKYLPTTEDPNAIPYYTNNPKSLLYSNILGNIFEQLQKEKAKPPKEVEVVKEVVKEVEVPVEKIVYKDKIVEVVKGDDDRSIGDLLSAVWKKLFKIK